MMMRIFLLVAALLLPAACGGGGSAAAPSAAAPTTPAPAIVVPGAPGGVAASVGDASITVSFTAPASDGGAPISSYTANCTAAGASRTASAAASPITLTGLTNGTSYIFRVSASNNVGQSPYSDVSNTVVPHTIPDAPTALTASALDTAVALAWAAPSSAGGGDHSSKSGIPPLDPAWSSAISRSTSSSRRVSAVASPA